MRSHFILRIFTLICSLQIAPLLAYEVRDDAGQILSFASPPEKIVSLVVSANEVIAPMGAAESLVGITYHDQHITELTGKKIIGGAFTPQWPLIKALEPDLLIVPPRFHEEARRQMGDIPVYVWELGGNLSIAERNIEQIGRILQREQEAASVLKNNQDMLDLIAKKVAVLDPKTRKRVMRVLYHDGKIYTAGSDSFQTELIRAAGGIPPAADEGAFVSFSKEDWERFNPQVIYGCGQDLTDLKEFLMQEGWKEADAIKNGQIFNFPCALTCRAAAHTGYFTAWLSSSIYSEEFADETNFIRQNGIVGERLLTIDMPYIDKARIVESRIYDFTHRTLLIDFVQPHAIISTETGQRDAIKTVGNSFSPTSTWNIYHNLGYRKANEALFQTLKLDENEADILSTGADMNNLVIRNARFRDLSVAVLVTAGVESNAIRSGRDTGRYYEPGTINIIVLSSHKLDRRAATRALITVTEAKTAALWDMDIRSSQTPVQNPATGTGTDSIIIVSGNAEPELTMSGGHSKLGELIAEAVHGAVKEAVLKQNGKTERRSVFDRLSERNLSVHRLLNGSCSDACLSPQAKNTLQRDLEALLLVPKYQAFIETAFALDDAFIMGQLDNDLTFRMLALSLAAGISGKPVASVEIILEEEGIPPFLNLAFNALATGLKYKETGK